jgi:hypothetical protein
MAITLEHPDPPYVAYRGDFGILTYMRAAEDRAKHRRAAVDRAHELFFTAQKDCRPGAEIGGLGLLVLQRSLFAAEDLGLLLHAFRGPEPWERLRSANVPDLDAAFEDVITAPDTVVERTFRLPTVDQLRTRGRTEVQRRGLLWLRENAERRWTEMLRRAAWLWLEHRDVAKATMHGFPVIAGTHINGPPGAGELSDGIPPQTERYGVAITSRVKGKEVTTERTIVQLGNVRVARFQRHARIAIRATVELAEAQAGSTMAAYGATLPLRAARYLDAETQLALEELVAAEEPAGDG